MKLLKTLAPLAAMAIAAAVFAAPAMANESIHFFHADGTPIGEEESTTVHFTGNASFEGENGGVACEHVTAIVTFTTHESHVTAFEPTENGECHTTGLLGAFCSTKSETSPEAWNGGKPLSSENSWTLTPESTSTAMVKGQAAYIHNPMAPGCFFGENIDIEERETETETNHASINTVESGVIGAVTLSGTMYAASLGEVVTVSGELTPTPEEPTIRVGET